MEIGGLPLHILLLHLVVVLAPVVAVAGAAYVARPRWRRLLAWPLAIGAVLNAVASVVTAHYGEELQHALGNSPAIELHATWGDVLKWVAVGFAAAAALLLLAREAGLASVGWLRWTAALRRQAWLPAAASVLVLVLGVAMVVATVVTGHSGATAVWTGWRNR